MNRYGASTGGTITRMIRTLIGLGVIAVGWYIASIGEPGGGAPTNTGFLGAVILAIGFVYLAFRLINSLPSIPPTKKSAIIAVILFTVCVALIVAVNMTVPAVVQTPILP